MGGAQFGSANESANSYHVNLDYFWPCIGDISSNTDYLCQPHTMWLDINPPNPKSTGQSLLHLGLFAMIEGLREIT